MPVVAVGPSFAQVVAEAQQLLVEQEVSLLLEVVAEVLPFFAQVMEVLPFVQTPSDRSWCRTFVLLRAVYRILYRMP